jgi:hypothetical protein
VLNGGIDGNYGRSLGIGYEGGILTSTKLEELTASNTELTLVFIFLHFVLTLHFDVPLLVV